MIKKVAPIRGIRARVRLPGSKSITHRALIIAALSGKETRIENPLRAEDSAITARVLEGLGAAVKWAEDSVSVTPPAALWRTPGAPFQLGNSGTSARLLIAVAAAGSGKFVFDGTERLRERPVGPIAEALESLGVTVRWLGRPGYPPVEIESSGIAGGSATVDARESSQFLSGLLMAAPCAGRDVLIDWPEPAASFPYVLMTLAMMKTAGIEFQGFGPNRILVPAPQPYSLPSGYTVEGDCSSASYFWAAAAILGGEVHTWPIPRESLQGDCRFLDVLEKMGCRIQWMDTGVTVIGPDALLPVDADMNRMPDMAPTLAMLAAFAGGQSRIRNVAHLRIKESDRLAAVAAELTKLSVPVEELPDGLVIQGGKVAAPTEPIKAHNDHRIAMSFALAGLKIEGVRIDGAEAVGKSFPEFWDIFERLGDAND